ncbi:DNA translocase FtsK [endosymbiont of Acanthamoeba sp. UWC8]|nr:DNA translocase FtsK [endosymbiont of Acanthamoeba sp. UWC8]
MIVSKAKFNLNSFFLRCLGALIIALAIFLFISFISFNAGDPSFNQVNDNEVKNLAGYYGAFIADPILQSLGFASYFIVIFLTTLGLKILTLKEIGFLTVRIAFLILLLPFLAACLTFIKPIPSQNFISYGGFIGVFVKEELSVYFNPKHIFYSIFPIIIIVSLLTLNINYKEFKKFIIVIIRLFTYGAKLFAWAMVSLYILIRGKIAKKTNETTVENQEANIEIEKPKPILTIKNKMPRFEPKKDVLYSTPRSSSSDFQLPPTALLKEPPITSKKNQLSEAALNQNSRLLTQVLQDFGVYGNILSIRPGPVVTLYELEPSAGTKSSRVIGLADDISRSMSAVSARISVIPGKNALGIELPNTSREIVYLRELMESETYVATEGKLPLVLGKNIGGDPIIADLAKMPHLLVAGTTGSGKSVAINTMVLSLLYKLSPKECQFIMIDPKMLELSVYEGIPHLLTPVVTEPKKAVAALKWVVKEMENRYRSMSILGVRNIQGFNKAIEESISKGQRLEKQIQTGFDQETGKPTFETIEMPAEPLPYIVVIVDEMADLMLVAGKDIEGYIQRLAQMARAAGIHIIMATQRPSVDVITGVIKANFPTRISFQVTSKIDSRTILGEQGAEQLLGMGDMLYMMGGGKIERVHGPFVGDKEVEMVVDYLKSQGSPKYKIEITLDEDEEGDSIINMAGGDTDDLYSQAVAIVLRDRRPTTSYLQRCLKVGYNKAASLIEKMEKEGILSPPNHTGKREILVND